jgi:hypothetical protein
MVDPSWKPGTTNTGKSRETASTMTSFAMAMMVMDRASDRSHSYTTVDARRALIFVAELGSKGRRERGEGRVSPARTGMGTEVTRKFDSATRHPPLSQQAYSRNTD